MDAAALVPAPPPALAMLPPSPGHAALAAQLQALKLQVSQLRCTNARLAQQLAAAGAERAAAAKHAALAQLVQLRLDGGGDGGQAPHSPRTAAAAAALHAELGVQLHPAADVVPLHCLQQLHDSFQRRLAALQAQHAAGLQRLEQGHANALERQQEEHEQELQRQVGAVRGCALLLHSTAVLARALPLHRTAGGAASARGACAGGRGRRCGTAGRGAAAAGRLPLPQGVPAACLPACTCLAPRACGLGSDSFLLLPRLFLGVGCRV